MNKVRGMIMGILGGNPKDQPMHYGEVFSTWSFLLTTRLVAGFQTHLNHAGDEDLQKLLVEAIEGGQQEIKQIEILLKEMEWDYLHPLLNDLKLV